MIHMASDARDPGNKHKFLFTSAGGRAWEARQNAQAARESLRRLVPALAPEPDSSQPPAAAGSSGGAFRRVMAILATKGGWR